MSGPIRDAARRPAPYGQPPDEGGGQLTPPLIIPPLDLLPHRSGRWRSTALHEAIVWLVVLPFLPWVLLERRRRRLEGQTEQGARRERALNASLRRLKALLREGQDAGHT